MVLLSRIQILGIDLAVLEEGQGAYGVLAGVEEVDHRLTFAVEGEAVMNLHPTG
mgnify:CR=1 FL=1